MTVAGRYRPPPVVLAIDHVAAMRATLAAPTLDLGPIKVALAAAAPGSVLTDANTSVDLVRAALRPGAEFWLAAEDGDYAEPSKSPRLLPGWSVELLISAGARVIKTFAYLPVAGPQRDAALEFFAEVGSCCRSAGVAHLAEPIVVVADGPDPSEAGDRHAAAVVAAAGEINRLPVDVAKLEFPGRGALSEADGSRRCGEVDDAIEVPWVLLSAGVTFEQFRTQLRAAVSRGAAGCVVGRAVWGDLVTVDGLADADARVVTDRLLQLEHIVETQRNL